jgi:nitrite reductase (NADH) small subunit
MFDVADAGALREGLPVSVTAAGRNIVFVLWGDSVFALRDVCPHQTQSFVGGYAHENVVCEQGVGTVAVRQDEPVLECPIHSWTFRLQDGRCVADPALRVRTYPAEIRAGRVFVAIGGEAVERAGVAVGEAVVPPAV